MREVMLVILYTFVVVAYSTAAAEDATARPSNLPLIAESVISGRMGRDLVEYRIEASGGDHLHATNSQQRITVDFTAGGVEFQAARVRWRTTLLSYGYDNDLQQPQTSRPIADVNTVEYDRGPLREWYVNGPLGVEQGFTVSSPPHGVKRSALVLVILLTGSAVPTVDSNREVLTLTDLKGDVEYRYVGLSARDATGKKLRAWLQLDGNQLKLNVSDLGARYPIVIDPLVQLAQLSASDGKVGDQFGSSVAVSGNTAVVGAPNASDGSQSLGAAYVFVKAANGWNNMTQTAKLTGSDSGVTIPSGSPVAISGNTIVTSAFDSTISQYALLVFVEPATGWADMTQTAELTVSDGGTNAGGFAGIAISGDTIAAGVPTSTVNGNRQQGAAYVFVKPAGGWQNMTQTAKLTASDGQPASVFGWSVSEYGRTVVAGAIGNNFGQGAAYVFVEPKGGWSNMTQTAELTASDGAANFNFGYSVSASSSTIVIGAPFTIVGSKFQQGKAYIFVKPLNGWKSADENAQLTARNGIATNYFGYSVAISASSILVGAPNVNQGQGAAYLFLKPASGWLTTSRYNAELVPQGNNVGAASALAGATLLVGAPSGLFGGHQHQGAAFVFGQQTVLTRRREHERSID
jgi:hypothetical protein